MKLTTASVCLLVLLGAGSLQSAENPFVGTWKLNQEKSHMTGDTMKFAPAASGMIRVTAAGTSYTFKTDGQNYTTPFSNKAAWKKIDDNTWETTYTKTDGTVLSTDTLKLSDDGKTLTNESKGTKPNGDNFDDTSVYVRVSGQSGLMGTWKSKEVKISSPSTLDFQASGADGMSVALPDLKATCDVKFDSKPYTCTGPTVPDGLTLAATRTNPRSFRWLEKLKGKPLFSDKFTVSTDGKTMTDLSTPVGVNEPATMVYEKQ